MSSLLNPQDILGRIPFANDQRPLNYLPLPGNSLDGQQFGHRSGLFSASKQVSVITLGGSTATGNISTLTITPTRTASGSPWVDAIGALVITVTTGVTQTLTALGELVEAEAAAIVAISSLTDLSNWQPIRDFCSVTAASGMITVTTRDEGARFTVTWVSDGSATASTSSTGTTEDELRVGTVAILSSFTNGYPNIIAPVAASAATAIFGVIAEQNAASPATSGYSFKVIAAGKDVKCYHYGNVTAYCEGAATVDGSVYVRKTATGTEIAGALAGTAVVDTPQVITITPSATNSVAYRAQLRLTNFFTGALVAQGELSMTSDGSATATEICDGLRTSLVDDNDQFDGLVTGTGTATLILTVASPNVLTVSFTSPGVLAQAETTAAASDHLLWSGARFMETTTAAGTQAISIPHP